MFSQIMFIPFSSELLQYVSTRFLLHMLLAPVRDCGKHYDFIFFFTFCWELFEPLCAVKVVIIKFCVQYLLPVLNVNNILVRTGLSRQTICSCQCLQVALSTVLAFINDVALKFRICLSRKENNSVFSQLSYIAALTQPLLFLQSIMLQLYN